MKSVAILNGKLGSNRASLNSSLSRFFEEDGVRCLVTNSPGHARVLAEEQKNAGEIVVIGGDGTLHEVLSSLHFPFPKIRLVPAGTGNSLARHLGLEKWNTSSKPKKSGKLLKIDLLEIDLLTVSGRFRCYSASTISFGFPATVTRMANRRFKKLRRFCYPVAAGLGVLFQRRKTYRTGYDGLDLRRVSLTGCILNNTEYVANFLAFPEASCSDGKFEVLELNAGILKQTLHNLSVLSRKYFYQPSRPFGVREARIQFETPDILMIDGEVYDNVSEFSVKILPKALEIYAAG